MILEFEDGHLIHDKILKIDRHKELVWSNLFLLPSLFVVGISGGSL